MQIGFIGLGIMGAPMAEHLVAGGHSLAVFGGRRVPDSLRSKATLCKTIKEVAEKAEVIILMVPDTPDVEAVLFGAESGGEVGAKAASLTIMIGGSEATFERVKPLFALMGKNITLVGGNGDGQTTKVANQIIVALTIEAVGEALLFASRAGADPAKVRAALMGGFASSRILEVHGERMIKRNFQPGFRIELHQKDLNLALSGARALHLSLPNTATCQELFNSASAHGGAAWDHSGMVKVLENLAGHEIGQKK